MQYTKFPKSKDKVSRLGFGAMGLAGWFEDQSEKANEDSVINALEQGVNFIDTARAYGDSEKIIGRALKRWQGARPFIATKVDSRGADNTRWGIPPDVNETFPRGHARQSLETSLQMLGVDYVDLLQLHLYWPTWGTEGYWMDELQALKEEGKVRNIGVSAPDCRGDVTLPLVQSGKIDSVQAVFNIFDPTPLDCLIPIAQQNEVAILARCIMDEGGLTGFLSQDRVFSDSDFRKTFFDNVPREQYIDRVEALKEFVPEYASSLAALAIKFVIKHPGVTTALTSMHMKKYADMNIQVMDEPELPDSVFNEIRMFHRWVRNFYDTKYWDRNAVGGSRSV